MSDFAWPTMTNTNESSLTPYVHDATFNYVTDWVQRSEPIVTGPCLAGEPWFSIGLPWGGELVADVPDINADPWIGPWVSMTVLVQVTALYSNSWNCPCHDVCTLDGQTLETQCTGGGTVLQCTSASEHTPAPFYDLDPPTSGPVPAHVGPVASTYAKFQFDRVAASPLPTFQVKIDNEGNYIRAQVTLWAHVLYETYVVPPPVVLPPPPVDWPTPTSPAAPPCGLFTPH